ncbi:LacI family DNA-binding transcriptional regulator (plasmid) [Rhizobium lusitanum]|nr:LacI family DNA-binding transcriptional regulator [Rhizobium lusitanum]
MAREPTKPTIYDVAQRSGAAPSTVSSALSGHAKGRRIKPETVARIREAAAELGYAPNLQAQGLRKSRSGLIGMLLPVHDNRFFSSLSQHFASEVRARGLCPVIISTRREPDEEIQSVEDLLAYSIDALLIAGATAPEELSSICRRASLPHVFVDLPSANSPSVVSDNTYGAEQLTTTILDLMPATGNPLRDRIYFLGGNPQFYATSRRVEAFHRVVMDRTSGVSPDQIINCGYVPARAAEELEKLIHTIGGLPAGLFINSIPVLEGALSHLVNLPPDAFAESVIGCYDYDPFGAFLQFPLHMVMQNPRELIGKAFALLDSRTSDPVLEMVKPELISPHTIQRESLGERG